MSRPETIHFNDELSPNDNKRQVEQVKARINLNLNNNKQSRFEVMQSEEDEKSQTKKES